MELRRREEALAPGEAAAEAKRAELGTWEEQLAKVGWVGRLLHCWGSRKT